MYRKRIFGVVGDFNEALRACDDYELYLRIVRQFPIYCHGDMVAEYRRHEGNMTINAAPEDDDRGAKIAAKIL